MDDHSAKSQVAAGEKAFGVWARRARIEVSDFEAAIAAVSPDLALVDTTTYGAKAVAERERLPWVESRPFLLEDPAPGVPPFGFGLKPMHGPFSRLRDAAAQYDMDLVDTAHLLAAGDRAAEDAAMATWQSKYTYLFWRPLTDVLQVSVFGPATVTPGQPAAVSVYLHTPESADSVRTLSRAFHHDAELIGAPRLTGSAHVPSCQWATHKS